VKPLDLEAIQRARMLCITAHSAVGQTRKYITIPYYHHPLQVANFVRSFGGRGRDNAGNDVTSEMITAAYLHDVVEDTELELSHLEMFFSPIVVELVSQVTDVSNPSDGNREARKQLDRDHLAKAWHAAQVLKCADILHNALDIKEHDEDFWKIYQKECKKSLDVMDKVQHSHPLKRRAYEILLEESSDER
jgi:(p)ppGpp synthase/HD superfamily hydrolase